MVGHAVAPHGTGWLPVVLRLPASGGPSNKDACPVGRRHQPSGNPMSASIHRGLSIRPDELLRPSRTAASVSVVPAWRPLSGVQFPAMPDARESSRVGVGQGVSSTAIRCNDGRPFVAYSSRPSPGQPLLLLP